MVIFAFVAYEFLDQISRCNVSSLLLSHDRSLKAQSEADSDSILERPCENVRESTIVELCQKPEGT